MAGTGGGIGFDLLLVAHVLSAALALAAVLATGAYASWARRPGSPAAVGAVQRYFSPGTNWLPRVLYLVPVLGVVLLVLGHRTGRFTELWLWLSSGLWVVAAVLAQGVLWPAERRLQALLAVGEAGSDAVVTPGRAGELGRFSRRAAWAAAGIDLCLLGGFVLMIGRPGSV